MFWIFRLIGLRWFSLSRLLGPSTLTKPLFYLLALPALDRLCVVSLWPHPPSPGSCFLCARRDRDACLRVQPSWSLRLQVLPLPAPTGVSFLFVRWRRPFNRSTQSVNIQRNDWCEQVCHLAVRCPRAVFLLGTFLHSCLLWINKVFSLIPCYLFCWPLFCSFRYLVVTQETAVWILDLF